MKQTQYKWLEENHLPKGDNNCVIWPFSLKYGKPICSFGGKGKKINVARVVLEWKLLRPLKENHYAYPSCGNRICISSNCLIEREGDFLPKNSYQWLVDNYKSDTCVIWPFKKCPKGYPRVDKDGNRLDAHRVALALELGRPIKKGYFSCKLTEQQVLEIRNRYLIGSKKISHAELTKDYGVSTSTILSIISRETWKHI